jgi:NADPH2:quinone reductase
MKAWMVTAVGAPADVLEIGEREPPDPVPGEVGVEVRVAAAGLPDVFMCRGQYEFDPPLPFTPGEEVAGVVTDARHAPGFEPGQRVMGVTAFYRGHGGFAERSVLVADATWPIPEEMSDVDAAAFGIPFRTAYLGLVTRGRLSEGETLLVHGAAGGTGFAAVQVGKAVGARVIAVASGAEKCQACRESGANEVIDRSQRDFVDTVKALTEGRGVDVVFDPVGGDTFVRSLDCLATEGRLLAIGFASGAWADAPTGKIVARNLTVVGVVAVPPSAKVAEQMYRQLMAWYDEGLVRPVVAGTYAFEQLPQALSAIEASRVGGKSVIVVR